MTRRLTEHPAAATVALLAATAIWGSTFIVVQDGINAMPMQMFMAWRFVIATSLMIALRPSALRMSRDTLRKGVFIGIALAIGYWVQTYGLLFTSATVSGFITGMFVVLTPVAALVVYGMRIGWSGWLAVALATAGVALISLKGWSFGWGETWTLVGAACFSFQIMWLSRWATPETSYSLAILQMGTTALLFSGGAMLFEGFSLPPRADVWGALLFLAIFASAFAFIVQSWAQSQMTPTRAAVVLSMEPVFAAGFGVALGGDSITLRIVLGGLAILAAMLLVELAPKPSEAARDLAEPHQGV